MQIYFLQPSLIIFTKGANYSELHCRFWGGARQTRMVAWNGEVPGF